MISMMNDGAIVTMREFHRKLQYAGTVVIAIEAVFPQVEIPGNRPAQNRINARIRAQVGQFIRYSGSALYRRAVLQYRDSQNNAFPFHPYDAVLHYEITYNANCYLSAFRDRYEFTGGAHGNTIRFADTWSLKSGRLLTLRQIFGYCAGYRNLLLEQILKQADGMMKHQPGVLFEDYRKLIVRYFNGEHFYLTPDGLAVYYQQYEIAPYSSGIMVFTIPYGIIGWQPSCRQ